MAYTEPVKFTKTGQYGHDLDELENDVYTVEEFKKFCASGAFIDYDGFGYPVRRRKADPTITIKPSKLKMIPSDATHIVWYNR